MSQWLCKSSADSPALDFTPAPSTASWAGGPGVQSVLSSAATVCRLMARSTGDCSPRWVWRNRRDDNRSLLSSGNVELEFVPEPQHQYRAKNRNDYPGGMKLRARPGTRKDVRH